MLVLTLVLICGGGALVFSQQLKKQYYTLDLAEEYFEEFIETYGRHYPSQQEKQKRLEIFKQNLVKINELNRKSELAVFGITKFSDFTKKELKMYRGLIKETGDIGNCTIYSEDDVTTKDAPESFDWRDKNAVTDIKEQRKCGSCWAFSAIGNVEGQHAIKHKELVQLSEQQLVDCDDRSSRCCGGLVINALSKLAELGGSQTSADYSYTSCYGQCKFDSTKIHTKVIGCNAYNLRDQDVLKELLYKTGPLAISIDADALIDYHGGILDVDSPSNRLDHGVLLVGYGIENAELYWIVKNSWGKNWGEQGYFRLRRGKNLNVCGMMDDFVVTAIVA